MKSATRIKCPTCKRVGQWFATPFGPFCSNRCQWVDLGKWFDEELRISEPLRPDHFQDYANLPPGVELDRPEPNE